MWDYFNPQIKDNSDVNSVFKNDSEIVTYLNNLKSLVGAGQTLSQLDLSNLEKLNNGFWETEDG